MKLNEFAVYASDSIIVTFLSGTIDESAALQYCADVEQCVEALSGAPFGCLINGLDAIGCTPKAYEIFDAHNRWMHHQPMVAKAIVVIDEYSKEILLKRVSSIDTDNIQVFETEDAAKQWLDEKMKAHQA